MPTDTAARTARLRVDDKGDGGVPRVLLNDVDLAPLLACDGLRIEYTTEGLPVAMPTVTMKFGAGALELDIDVDLARRIVAEADQ